MHLVVLLVVAHLIDRGQVFACLVNLLLKRLECSRSSSGHEVTEPHERCVGPAQLGDAVAENLQLVRAASSYFIELCACHTQLDQLSVGDALRRSSQRVLDLLRIHAKFLQVFSCVLVHEAGGHLLEFCARVVAVLEDPVGDLPDLGVLFVIEVACLWVDDWCFLEPRRRVAPLLT